MIRDTREGKRAVPTRDETAAADRRDALLSRLHRYGMRRTVARAAVLEALLAAPHQSINNLHARIAARGIPVDLSSVHRIVEAFVSAGLAHALPTLGGSTYGLADRPHYHAVCTHCSGVQEVAASQFSAVLASIAQSTGLLVTAADPTSGLVVYGTCANCQNSHRDGGQDPAAAWS